MDGKEIFFYLHWINLHKRKEQPQRKGWSKCRRERERLAPHFGIACLLLGANLFLFSFTARAREEEGGTKVCLRRDQPQHWEKEKITVWMLRLFRSLSRFETQDIKTQPQFNHYLIPYVWGWDYVLIGPFFLEAVRFQTNKDNFWRPLRNKDLM